ncbi:MAG TPA: NADH-quinone oxidoreductase subunit M [Candidatus Binatus sp.]|nr:NADH-quinone oxidoreductase subunit M [Candidatus Binatus sp.]
MTLLLIGSILLPLASAPTAYVLSRWLREKVGYFSFATLLIPLIVFIFAASQGQGQPQGAYQEAYSWSPIGQFGLRVDNLSFPILFTISLLTALISLFSMPYMRHKIGDEASPSKYGLYFALYNLYALGMLGTVLATNLIQFYAFFEIMLVPSFFLIAEWGYGDKERISLMYFIWTHVGALVLLVGILLTGYSTGGVTDMASLTPALVQTIPGLLRLIIVASMCFGFFVKMAQFGVHIWLPYAHAEAPTPVSALLSPAMIGIGGYAVVRIVMTIFPEAFLALSGFFAALAVVTMFYGAMMAMVQDDIKRLLAYSSVSQMGYILFGLAASDSFGVAGSMFQYVSHGTAKGILFMVAGAIILQAHGERSIKKLGGLASRMPITATAAFIGFLAIVGLPATNGFLSEFVLFQGGFIRATNTPTLFRLIIAVLGVVATALTAGYSLWTLRRIFFGPTNEQTATVNEAPFTVTIPLIVLSIVTIILGIYPEPILGGLFTAARSIFGGL